MNERIFPQGNAEGEMGSSIEIVAATPDQWETLRNLKLRSIEQEPIAFLDPAEGKVRWEQRTEDEWKAILSGRRSDNSETIVLLAQDGERAIGMVQGEIPAPSLCPERIAEIMHMYVDGEGYRGKGIGKKLLTTLLSQLQERGDIDAAELTVVTTQKAAQELYKSLGFLPRWLAKRAAKRGDTEYDELVMRRQFKL